MKNRAIEFRFWDFRLQNYTYFDLGCSLPLYLDKKEGVVEQFTGLFDKNGTKIFEGDILKIRDHILLEEVVFTHGCFGVVLNWKNSSEGWYKRNDYANFEPISNIFYPHDLEVIGNINQNPELLK